MKYNIEFTNAGDGKRHKITRTDAHEAFIEAIEVTDNKSNYDIDFWIENN